ncbi:MAG: 50S ribosomal protein L11 methyltransferase [Leeuwenhoekiella sp.]
MVQPYLEYDFKVSPANPGVEILIAQLSEFGFESFDESGAGLKAYITSAEAGDFDVEKLPLLYNPQFKITFSHQEIEPINWNEAWEKNFDPIDVEGKCRVRAPFHPKTDTDYDIVIQPKMSFGTGHHETTHLMIKHLLRTDCKGKKVLDMGSGTAVLAILAALKGAKPVEAIDIDPWCLENGRENVDRNAVGHIAVQLGDVRLLDGKNFDIIIANINRNILMSDIPAYAECLTTDGVLFLSGFYTEDIPVITTICNTHGLDFVMNFEKNNWVACKFVKQ